VITLLKNKKYKRKPFIEGGNIYKNKNCSLKMAEIGRILGHRGRDAINPFRPNPNCCCSSYSLCLSFSNLFLSMSTLGNPCFNQGPLKE